MLGEARRIDSRWRASSSARGIVCIFVIEPSK